MNRLRPSRASHVLLPAALCALAIPAAAQPGLRPGQPVSGTLAVSDLRLNDGSYADHFTYRGRRGERLVVVMRSGDFDTYLALGRGGGADFAQLSAADDGAGGTDSRLEFILPDDGEYTVRANSLRKGQTGAYTLEVQGAGAAPGPPPEEPGAAERVERGTLGPGDGTLRTGEYRDSYTLQGRRGERLVLDLRSRDLDPYLILVKPDGEQEENDDYEGDARRSLLSVELPADGEYRVLATTYAPRTTGSYELRISRGGAGSAGGGTRREQGRLESGDGTLRTGEYRDSYTL
ncbi:MAG TPA: hypothetical protein VFX98_00700, partial [Longimicrobiaceae bacterium]|nr:hypothetical protein [Longimicrobiaceae bacterium]